jgi:ATP-binding cassette subfamily B protein
LKISKSAINASFVKQADQTDCGVACLLAIIKYHKGSSSLEQLRTLSGTSKQGTTLLGLFQSAQSFGFDAEGLEAEKVDNLKELNEPAILHVQLEGKYLHYYVFWGFDKNDNIILTDPALGLITLSKKELEKVWQSKALLKLSPNIDFIRKKLIGSVKLVWFKDIIRDDVSILLVAVALGLSIALLGISTAIFSQKIIDNIIPSKNLNLLIIGLCLFGFLLVTKSCLGYLRGFVINKQNRAFNNRIIASFYGSLINLPKVFFDSRKVGDLVARMNDTRRIQSTINAVVGSLLIDILVVAISLLTIFFYSSSAGLIILSSIVLYLLATLKFHNIIVRSQKETMQAYALNESNYIDTIQGIECIKSNNKEPFFSSLTQTIYGYFQHKVYNLGIVNIKFGFWSELLGTLALLSIIGVSSYQVISGSILVGEMVAILTLSGSIIPAIIRVSVFNIQLQEAKVAFDRMYEFSGLQSELLDEEKKIVISDFNNLTIDKIHFRFPGQKLLLSNISIKVGKGEFISVLGESGVGKSTLIQILLKFYKTESGNILINDHNLNDIFTIAWRNMIGVVPQKIKIFNSTLIDNICLGDSSIETDKVQAFCECYGFDKYFLSLPQGYNTLLGEEGINISGGQQQLVALARALYKKPKFLILDEATSAMDRNTENFILELIVKLRNEITVLMVTHRIKTASKSDRIYILENGTIQNSGTPNDLLKYENFYSLSYNELISC